MRYFGLILVLNLLALAVLKSQPAADTLPPYWKLDSANRAAYEKFDKAFSKWFHGSYCKKMKIKINCAGCSAFIFDLTLKIDSAGKIKVLTQGENKFCGIPLTEKQKAEFIKGFSSYILNPYFRNKIIPFRFSRVLKC